MKTIIKSKLHIIVLVTIVILSITGCVSPPVLVSIDQIAGKSEVIKSEPRTVSRYEAREVTAKVDFADYLYPAFLDETLSGLDFPDPLQGSLSKKDKITLVSIERPTPGTIDADIFLERALTKKLLEKGYSVYNRNMNVMRQSVIENNSVPVIGVDSTRWFDLNYKLPSSDMILGYRLLELGCYKLNSTSKDSVIRVGKALVEVSVVNPKTQQIIYDDVLKAYNERTISNQLESTVQSFHYQIKPYSYTVGSPAVTGISNYTVPVKTESREIKTQVDVKPVTNVTKSQVLFILTNISSKIEFMIMDAVSRIDVKYFSLDSGNKLNQVKYEWNLSDNDGDDVKPGDFSLFFRDGFSSSWVMLKGFSVKP